MADSPVDRIEAYFGSEVATPSESSALGWRTSGYQFHVAMVLDGGRSSS